MHSKTVLILTEVRRYRYVTALVDLLSVKAYGRLSCFVLAGDTNAKHDSSRNGTTCAYYAHESMTSYTEFLIQRSHPCLVSTPACEA